MDQQRKRAQNKNMRAFLYETAKNILSKYKSDIQSYCFVFPNKRTNFFFRKYYSELYGASHKAPKMLEIRRLIHQFTSQIELKDSLGWLMLSLLSWLPSIFVSVQTLLDIWG